jgi:hypothetical protein
MNRFEDRDGVRFTFEPFANTGAYRLITQAYPHEDAPVGTMDTWKTLAIFNWAQLRTLQNDLNEFFESQADHERD